MTRASFSQYWPGGISQSDSPWCHSTARKPPAPSCQIRVIIHANRSSPGCHWRTLEPP